MSILHFLRRSVTLEQSRVFEGMVDTHSHLIPGVDDGIKQMDEALAVLRLYEELGVRKLYCTPHIMEDLPNKTALLQAHFDQLKATYKGSIELKLAAEYMIDNLLLTRLSEKDLLPHGERGDHLLIETSYYSSPGCFDEAVDKVRSMGLWPMLAHPERYTYMEIRQYESLKEQGVKFQLNITSLLGKYGEEARDKARILLEKNLYDFVGTDVHRLDPQFPSRKIKKSDVNLLNRLIG